MLCSFCHVKMAKHVCAQCRQAVYCSAECQRQHWKSDGVATSVSGSFAPAHYSQCQPLPSVDDALAIRVFANRMREQHGVTPFGAIPSDVIRLTFEPLADWVYMMVRNQQGHYVLLRFDPLLHAYHNFGVLDERWESVAGMVQWNNNTLIAIVWHRGGGDHPLLHVIDIPSFHTPPKAVIEPIAIKVTIKLAESGRLHSPEAGVAHADIQRFTWSADPMLVLSYDLDELLVMINLDVVLTIARERDATTEIGTSVREVLADYYWSARELDGQPIQLSRSDGSYASLVLYDHETNYYHHALGVHIRQFSAEKFELSVWTSKLNEQAYPALTFDRVVEEKLTRQKTWMAYGRYPAKIEPRLVGQLQETRGGDSTVALILAHDTLLTSSLKSTNVSLLGRLFTGMRGTNALSGVPALFRESQNGDIQPYVVVSNGAIVAFFHDTYRVFVRAPREALFAGSEPELDSWIEISGGAFPWLDAIGRKEDILYRGENIYESSVVAWKASASIRKEDSL